MTESEVGYMTKLVVVKDSEEIKCLHPLFLMKTGRRQSVSNEKKVIQDIK